MSEPARQAEEPSDARFQDLMADLGEAKARYDEVVRDVSVTDQPDDEFAVDRDRYERWHHASTELRRADDAILAFLRRAVR